MQQQVYSPVGPADATFVDPTQPVKVNQCLSIFDTFAVACVVAGVTFWLSLSCYICHALAHMPIYLQTL